MSEQHAYLSDHNIWEFTDDMGVIMDAEMKGQRVEIETCQEDLIVKINSELSHTIPPALQPYLHHAEPRWGTGIIVHDQPFHPRLVFDNESRDQSFFQECVLQGVHSFKTNRHDVPEYAADMGWVRKQDGTFAWDPSTAKKRKNSKRYNENHRRRYGKIRIDDVKAGVYILNSILYEFLPRTYFHQSTGCTYSSMSSVMTGHEMLSLGWTKEGDAWLKVSEKREKWLDWLQDVSHYAIGLQEVAGKDSSVCKRFGAFIQEQCEEENLLIPDYRKTPKKEGTT